MNESFKDELQALIKKYDDSLLAKYIEHCLNKYNKDNYLSNSNQENPFGVDVNKMPELKTSTPQPIPAPIGNKTSSGWNNPFGGTSWGL